MCTVSRASERKASKGSTFSRDDPKSSIELKYSVEIRMAKGAFSIRSPSGEFPLLGK